MAKRILSKLAVIGALIVLMLAVLPVTSPKWSETLTITGIIEIGEFDHGGTIGFWKNWDKHNTYTKAQINAWLVTTIDTNSEWLVPDIDKDGDIDVHDLILSAAGRTDQKRHHDVGGHPGRAVEYPGDLHAVRAVLHAVTADKCV